MRKQSGFTLVELMVTLAVAAILLGFGVPQITRILQGDRITANLNNLSAHLNYARSEAVKRGANVSVAALDAANPDKWELGWVVFVDPNNIGTRDAGEEVLRIVNALGVPNLTIRPTQNSVTFDRFGVAQQNTFTFAETGVAGSKKLTISNTGHVSIP